MKEPPHPVLAQGKVRYVGDHVAMVVAETLEQAKNAAEAVDVDYDVLPAVVDVRDARKRGAPQLHDAAPDNQCYKWAHRRQGRGRRGVRQGGARHEARPGQQPADPQRDRAARGDRRVQPRRRRVHALRRQPEPARRAPADDGVRAGPARAQGARDRARRRRRLRLQDLPVRRGRGADLGVQAAQSRRSSGPPSAAKSFLSDAHGRDHVTHAEMALDKDGKFLALRVHTDANLGAYLSTFATRGADHPLRHAAGRPVHDAADLRAKSTAGSPTPRRSMPTAAPAGPRRPTCSSGWYALRLGNGHARRTRSAGAISSRTFPYQTPVALQYDIGRLRRLRWTRPKELADVAGLRRAQGRGEPSAASCAASATRSYIEACGIAPSNIAGALGARAGLFECGEVRVHPTGSVTVFTGSHSHGQGHETTFAQVVAARLGMPVENVDVVHGDTGRVPFGMGTYGSRSIAVGGAAIMKALDKIEAKGKKIAAHLMEARDADIEFADGEFTVEGHRQEDPVRPGGADRLRAAQLSARQAGAGPERDRVLRPDQLHLPGRHLHLRGRGRPGDRRGADRPLHRGATTSAPSSTR